MPSKVLIADDSLKIQKELTQLLQGAGIEVVTVSNGEHAVRKLSTVQPDLVLADIFMPVRSGYEVCDYIKNSDEFGHVGVLLLASKMEPYDEKEAQRVRADGKLEKPLADTAAILATIQQHLEKVLGAKPAPPPPPVEEVAAAVPAAPEPEPEPEPFSTRPPPLSFQSDSPMGFSDMEEHPAAAPPPEKPVDLTQATTLSTAEELRHRMETPAPPLPEATQSEEPAPAPAEEKAVIEKPELAAAWEMTGPPPGAPEIPAAGGWDSQWTGGEEEAAPATEAPAEEAPVSPEKPYESEDFAAAFSAAREEPAPAPVEEPAATPEPAPPEPAAPAVDPRMVEEVVRQVLERISPQVTESLAREIVRPLTEALLKEKKKD